jgi:hypothetical protein
MNFLEKLDYDWLDLLNFQERPFRAKLIPSKVWKDLDLYRNDAVGLSNYCKKWRTKVQFCNQPKRTKTYDKYVAIGGEYDPEFRQCTIHVYTLNFNKFEFTDMSWYSFKRRFLQTLMHELIHFMQFDRRDDQWSTYVVPYKRVGQKKKDAERKYLSEFDEIQAYAHCAYLDLKMNRPRLSLDTLLSRCKNKRDSSTLHYFLKTFNYDFKNNPATQKIIQQIGKWDRKYKS